MVRPANRRLGLLALALIATALFDLAYTQYPLYDGNYNPYLLHGLASAGRGVLAGDWTAQTTDPFPLISGVVHLVYRAHPALFYVLHALLLGVYLLALVVIAGSVDERARRGWGAAFFGVLVIFVHSALFRATVTALTGGDWGWYVQGGLAQQYLLGFVFQPSLFGVLLVASIAAFSRRRDRLALILAALAVYSHFSYLLAALGLVAACGIVRGREPGAGRAEARRLWLLGLALLAPAVALVALRFGPSSSETFARAQGILAEIRIPNHALPERWLHRSGFIALALMLGALLSLRRHPLLLVVLVPLALGAVLTGLQVVTGSRSLALLFPWRISVVLVPLSSAVLLARVAAAGGRARAALTVIGAVVVVGAALFGLHVTRQEHRAYRADPALPMMEHVRSRISSAALYVVPVDLRRFRLETGARTLIDWKSHPYRDREILEWYERVNAVRRLERARGDEVCERAAQLATRYGITHLVLPAKQVEPLRCLQLVDRYRDAHFAVLEWAGSDQWK